MGRAFAFVGGGQLLTAVTQAAFVVLVLRTSGVAEFASYTLALSTYYVVFSISSSAFARAYFIEHETVVDRFGRVSFLGSQCAIAAGLLLVMQAVSPQGAVIGTLTAAFLASSLLFENMRWELQRQERFLAYTVTGVAQNTTNLVALVLFIVAGSAVDAPRLLAVQAASRFLIAAITLSVDSSLRGSLANVKIVAPIRNLVQRGYIYLAAYHGLDGLLTQLAVLILARMATAYDVATYGAAQRYVGIALVAVATARSVLLPLVGKAKSATELVGKRSEYRLIAVILTAIIAAPVATAGIWIPWLDGDAYPQSILVFQILSFAILLNLWTTFDSTLLIRHRLHKRLCVYVLAGVATNIVVAMLAIPTWGATGAAIGTIAGFVLFDLLMLAHGRRLRNSAPD